MNIIKKPNDLNFQDLGYLGCFVCFLLGKNDRLILNLYEDEKDNSQVLIEKNNKIREFIIIKR